MSDPRWSALRRYQRGSWRADCVLEDDGHQIDATRGPEGWQPLPVPPRPAEGEEPIK